MKYKLYQTDPSVCDYCFEWWSWAKDRFNFKRDYKEVYSGNIPPDEYSPTATLEQLFQEFNIHRPADFKGHSLSVSDIVELDGRYWYCDNVGWIDITKFINTDPVEPKAAEQSEPSAEEKIDDIFTAWNM